MGWPAGSWARGFLYGFHRLSGTADLTLQQAVTVDYDRGYWQVFRDAEQQVRTAPGVPERHVHEAEMKHREQGGPAAAP